MQFASSSSSEGEEPVFTQTSCAKFDVRLIREHGLWSHVLFNASRVAVDCVLDETVDVRDKAVLEIGGGCGVVSLACFAQGARLVCCNDFPDREITENIVFNF